MRRTSQRPKELHDPAIIVVLLGSAPCRFAGGALTDGRSPGGFTPEATVAARRGNTADASVWCLRHHPQCAARRRSSAASRPAALARRCGDAAGRVRRHDLGPHRPMIVLGPALILSADPACEPIPD